MNHIHGPFKVEVVEKSTFCENTGAKKKDFKQFWVKDANGDAVDMFSNEYTSTKETAFELAHLVSAAPEMVEALNDVHELILENEKGGCGCEMDNDISIICDWHKIKEAVVGALKKSRGENV